MLALEKMNGIDKSNGMAPEDQEDLARKWLEGKGLNEFGDPTGTMYMGGTPLFDEMTGESRSLISHLKQKFPGQPWLA